MAVEDLYIRKMRLHTTLLSLLQTSQNLRYCLEKGPWATSIRLRLSMRTLHYEGSSRARIRRTRYDDISVVVQTTSNV